MTLLPLLLPLCLAAPPAHHPRGVPHGLRAGPDGTWEVSDGATAPTLRIRSDGQLVGLGPAWEAPLPGADQWATAEGGGNVANLGPEDRKSTRLNSSHNPASRMPSSA
jgi:hypothetical protein